MKRIFTTLAILLFTSTCALAQAGSGGAVTVSGIEFRRVDAKVDATFEIRLDKKLTRSNYSLMIIPVLKNGAHRLEMPAVVVQGNRAAKAASRHKMAKSHRSGSENAVLARNGETVKYKYSFEYQPWMSGSSLVFDAVSVGCCSSTHINIGLIADYILVEPAKRERIIYKTETVETR